MESEKVKEIKKDIEICMKSLKCEGCSHHSQRSGECCRNLTTDILTLINELEKENERFRNTDLGELVKENEDLAKQCVDWSELDFKKRKTIQQLKDRIAELTKELEKEQINNLNCDTELQYKEKRIAELEKENTTLANSITCQVVLPNEMLEEIKKVCLEKVELAKDKLLKQFAEKLKEYIDRNETQTTFFGNKCFIDKETVDEILKKFIKE